MIRPARTLALVLLGTAVPHLYAADGAPPTSQPTAATRPILLAPAPGRPVFVAPGGTLHVVAQYLPADAPIEATLTTGRFPSRRHELTILTPKPAADGLIELRVAPDTPEQTYGLELRTGGVTLAVPHCVAVARLGKRVRLVHLSNMNVGDIGAPRFDDRLVEEVNLLDPTLIIATGDYLDATHTDPARGWVELSRFLDRFDAPILAAAGDHDDVSAYTQHLAPSPIGTLRFGDYEGLVLYDLPSRPISGDSEQLRWVRRQLAAPEPVKLRFVVAHDEAPNLLAVLRDDGSLEPTLRTARLGLWFSGGHRDWDGVEYRALLNAAGPLLFVRSAQASTAAREGAAGVSHYRIVDLEGERVFLPGTPDTNSGLPPSIAVGRLQAHFEQPNDGTQTEVAASIVNNLPFRLDRLAVRVRLRRGTEPRAWCQGATLARVADLGTMLECTLRFDLPEKGALRAVVGTGPAPPRPDVAVRCELPAELLLRRVRTADGVSYLEAVGGFGWIHLENLGTTSADIMPILRLDGETLSYQVVGQPGEPAAACALHLAAGQRVTLQVDATVARVAPGARELQVYLKGAPAWAPVCCPLHVVLRE